MASPLNKLAYTIYAKFHNFLASFESSKRLPDDQIVSVGNVDAAVFGMGRIGGAAYESMHERYGRKIIGVDFDQEKVHSLQQQGWNVIQGDATDYDFWQRIQMEETGPKMVMLAMPSFAANIYAVKRIRALGFSGTVAALVTFDDQAEKLKESGADLVFRAHKEAGAGFADHVCSHMKRQPIDAIKG